MTMHEVLDALSLAKEQLESFAELVAGSGGDNADLHAALAAVQQCIADLKASDGVLD